MISNTVSHVPKFTLRVRNSIVEFPVHYMRGGTSTGLVIHESLAPSNTDLREELLRHLMGVPLVGDSQGNRQITGLGRGPATSNKVFLADIEIADGRQRIVSTLAQLAADHAAIDWSVNCGNMSSALQIWALDNELLSTNEATIEIDIRNTNTGIVTKSRMTRNASGNFAVADIPGVDGPFPAVDLFLLEPVGSKTGRLLPTGQPRETIGGHTVSCVDVAVPMVIADAEEFNKTGYEPAAELASDRIFMESLRTIWVEAGLRMGLKRYDGTLMNADDLARSETIPKICIVAPPIQGGSISVRYFTPQTGHASMAVSGGCCLAAAALIPGSVANKIAQGLPALSGKNMEVAVAIENPAGILEATIIARQGEEGLAINSAAYRRNTQILMRGHVPLYRASSALVKALRNKD
ncbi:PrpF domain-containing protein [Desulfovibrio sp. UCD-KL4C]|uniref:PrpF domain-containing protein n=1 Tax=Desulfovibrio sp. UCD-KL4C TaxID=2578120 RepID=UPI0025BC91D6|nr:PrpF domain-containing protein [Desulfovibrio sp. UCD-KL4C]